LEELSALEQEMAHYSAPHGRLVVGASTTPGEVLVPHVASEFSARYPDVMLDVEIADTEETLKALLEREIEVAIVGREVDHPRLESRAIEQDELVPVVAATDPLAGSEVAPEDLADRPFVMREKGSATRQATEEGLYRLLGIGNLHVKHDVRIACGELRGYVRYQHLAGGRRSTDDQTSMWGRVVSHLLLQVGYLLQDSSCVICEALSRRGCSHTAAPNQQRDPKPLL